MESGTANLIHLLQQRVLELREQGEWAKAVQAVEAALDRAQAELNGETESTDEFVTCLEIRGDLRRQIGQLEEASEDFLEALDHLTGREDRLEQRGRLFGGLATTCEAGGLEKEAIIYYERAAECFEAADPPAALEVTAVLNNLAFLRRDSGDFSGAESAFLKALEYSHALHGPKHGDTADISNNVGALYHKVGYFLQAREMHQMALDARREVLGEFHPDTGQSYNNLALSLAENGEIDGALEYFGAALDIFSACGEDGWLDLEAVAENYAYYLRSAGREDEAMAMLERIGENLAVEI
jgi:tetratricopeptide (TPR) repeat protein